MNYSSRRETRRTNKDRDGTFIPNIGIGLEYKYETIERGDEGEGTTRCNLGGNMGNKRKTRRTNEDRDGTFIPNIDIGLEYKYETIERGDEGERTTRYSIYF